jgi:multidrug efflux system membrane fusion protein
MRILRFWLPLACVVATLPWLAACNGAAQQDTKANAHGGRGQGGPVQAVSVAVAPVQQQDLPVYLTGLGSIQAYNTVVVKTRIDGQLTQVAFREGQDVKQGQLLAVIDPRPYEVALSQAQATLFKDRAALQDAKINYDRYQGLFKDGVISQQQLDTQRSSTDQLEGAVRADEAQVNNQKLNLTYTRITAPVSGRVGLRLVDQGNMVHATDQNGLLVITQLQPIAALFTLPEDQLPEVEKHMRAGALQVEAYSRDDQTKLATGKLETIDNQIDPTTGTGRLKAVFTNAEHTLWPNQFVNVHMLLEVRKNSTVVPAAAVQRGPQGAYVFVVKADKTVDLRPVQVALTQADVTAIASGLTPGETVVTDGQDKLQAGSHIEPRPGNGGGQAKRLAQSSAQSITAQ